MEEPPVCDVGHYNSYCPRHFTFCDTLCCAFVSLLGEMEEPPVCHVGHWRAGLSAAGLEHLLLGDPFPHPGGGQYRQRETGSHQGGTLPNAGERGLLWLQPISNVTCTQTLHSDILLPFSAPLFPFFPCSPLLPYYTNHALSLQNVATLHVVYLLYTCHFL